ncbi:MAG: hypothetical protein ACXAEF_03675 [Candidatus Thorarchaeota archaeon]|jgi:hypothetical protein
MSNYPDEYVDRPEYDGSVVAVVMFASISPIIMGTVMAYIFFLLFATSYLLVILLACIFGGITIFFGPYLFLLPVEVSVNPTSLNVKYKARTLRIAHSTIRSHEWIRDPPIWVESNYIFPACQWLLVHRNTGLTRSLYIPTTDAEKLAMAIEHRRGAGIAP